MKCNRCDGNGKYKTIFGNTVICDICYGTGEIVYSEDDRIESIGNKKPTTNEEWFCQLPTEQKAKWLYNHYVNARADEYYSKQEKTLSEFQKWLVSIHREIDGTKID